MSVKFINVDEIKLDDLGSPDDNTDLNASTGAHGLSPKLSGNATDFYNGVGGFSVPAGTGDAAAIHDDVSGEIHAIAAKAVPVGADELIIEDSAASWAKKRVAISNLPAGDTSPLIIKGDLYTYSTVNARLPLGTNGQQLTVDTTQATGQTWIDALIYEVSNAVDVISPVGTATLDPAKKVVRFLWTDDVGADHELFAFRKNAIDFSVAGRAEILGDELDSATAVAVITGSDIEYTTVGAILLAIRNAGANRVTVAYDGALRSCISDTGGFHQIAPLKELVTIQASSYTDSNIEFPAGCLGMATGRIVTGIPGTSTWSLGYSGSTTRWGTGLSSGAGTTNEAVAFTNGWTFFSAATKIRITPNATPSGATGQVRIFALYEKVGAPTS